MRNVLMMTMVLFSMGLNTGFASDYYSDHAVGWHWYDDPEEVVPNKDNKQMAKPSDPTVEMNSIRQSIKRALDRAIINPTPENVDAYNQLEDQLTERANQFANMRAARLLYHPETNYSLAHPTNSVALQVYNGEVSSEKEAVITEFVKRSGLFFFYKSTCPYCKRFAPIIKDFAERFNINVVAITLDGISLPEFPDSKTDQGQAEKFHVTVEPSVFAVDPYTQKAFPISYGLVSEKELLDQFYKAITEYKGMSS